MNDHQQPRRTYNRGFIRPDAYVLKDGATQITVPETFAEFSPRDFLAIVDDIENRYGFLNTSDMKKTLYALLGVKGEFDRPEERPPIMREILEVLQAIARDLADTVWEDEDDEGDDDRPIDGRPQSR